MLILFDGDKEGSPTPETSGWDKVVFGIQVIDAPAINGMNVVFLSVLSSVRVLSTSARISECAYPGLIQGKAGSCWLPGME